MTLTSEYYTLYKETSKRGHLLNKGQAGLLFITEGLGWMLQTPMATSDGHLTFSGLAPKLLAVEVASAAALDKGSRRAADRGSLEGGSDRGSTEPDRGSSETAGVSSDFFLDLACFTLELSIDCNIGKTITDHYRHIDSVERRLGEISKGQGRGPAN